MSEHWKSTPKYWCKHCQCYVRDTKLEKQNHESTAKHQGALKRFLRDLHRGHEREERDKERARQEVERLNGIVSGKPVERQNNGQSSGASSSSGAAPSQAQLKTQREQLAALGIAMPDEFRPEMAMAGEWTVTNTRVIDDDEAALARKIKEAGEENPETRATGVRKRETTEEDREEEDAVRDLFKKRRKWGRDSRAMPKDEDADLDALLSGSILTRPPDAEGSMPKDEPVKDEPVKEERVKEEPAKPDEDAVKDEPDTEPSGFTATFKLERVEAKPTDTFKPEAMDAKPIKTEVQTEDAIEDAGPAPVVFKKRKAKTGMRQK